MNRRADSRFGGWIALLWLLLCSLFGALASLVLRSEFAVAAEAGAPVVFERDVRPILKLHCFQCHGEAGVREGGLDLRLAKLGAQGGDSGPAIAPGDPDASLLLRRVRSGEMPPVDKKPTEGEIEVLDRWIAGGALTARDEPETIGDEPLFTDEERGFWSFQPPVRSMPPSRETEAAHNAIDAFLLAKLGEHGLGFSQTAGDETLVRRVFFDLLGLPPSPEVIAQYIAMAESEGDDIAWEKLVDRLLASPRYGERWGRHWLDVAGYADSEGYTERDPEREWAWMYRDYVIRSFNADKPFDQFLTEQLAGDELASSEIAVTLLAGAPPNLSPEAIERLAATGFLRMAPDGVGDEGVDRDTATNQNIADTLQIVGSGLLGMTLHCAQCHDHRYDPIPQSDYYRLRAIFEPGLAWRNRRTSRERLVSLYTDADRAAAAAIESQAVAVEKEREAKAREYVARTLEEQLELIPPERRESLRIAFETEEPKRSDEQRALLKEYPSIANISVGSLYLYDGRRPERVRKLEQAREEKLARLIAEAQAKHPGVTVTADTLGAMDQEAAAELEAEASQIAFWKEFQPAADLKKRAEQAAQIRATKPPEKFLHALIEPAGEIHPTHVFHRGDHLEPREQVAPGDLSILGRTEGEIAADDPALPTSGRRLAFARYLMRGDHPLVARVLVNRIWKHHFGQGLVRTLADFGILGEKPSHPELLDWLASEFAQDWSLKRLHRAILSSRAYRQSSRIEEMAAAIDPENRLLGRMSLRRLEAEPLRDALLAIGGQLNDAMYGPPVPVMEDDVGRVVIGKENLDGEGKVDKPLPLFGEERRRSIYVQVRRSRPLAVLETFDAPAMAPHCENRDSSTAAGQSLLLMNDELPHQAAQRFAERVESEAGPEEEAQINRAFRIAFGRGPSADELAAASAFLAAQRSLAREAPAEGVPPPLSPLSGLCHGLVSANEFLYVD